MCARTGRSRRGGRAVITVCVIAGRNHQRVSSSATAFIPNLPTLAPGTPARVQRIVILKVDGLPDDLLEQYVKKTGGPGRDEHSRLPWIQHVFAQNGVWMDNFYVRGLSLSAPSWSLLDSGRHLQIRGNVEYDRYTLHPYDYLNFFPFYFGYAGSKTRHVDMPSVELMDAMPVSSPADRPVPLCAALPVFAAPAADPTAEFISRCPQARRLRQLA